MNRCIVSIRRFGETRFSAKGKAVPPGWIPSLAAMATSARQAPKLSRTLQMITGYELVELKRNGREIGQITSVPEFLVVLG